MWLAWCSGVAVAAVGLWLRVRPRLWLREFGVDTWYYLMAAEARRTQPRGWLRLPYFLLDIEEQWYPPLLTRLLSWLPQQRLERWQWIISPLVDTVQLAIAYAVTYLLTRQVAAAVVAGLVYATFPLLVTQHSTLNSRALGGLCLTLTMLAVWRWSAVGGGWWLAAAIASGVAVLHAHKLATQQLVFLLVGLAVAQGSWRYLALGGAIWAAALAVSRGGYLKILRGHVAILRFWRRQLPWLGAHLVYDSPLHRNAEKARGKRGVTGLRSSRRFSLLANAHAVAIVAVAATAPWWSRGAADPLLWHWALIGCLTVAATTWLPPVQFLGEGFRYAMYLVCPASVLVGQFAVTLPVAAAWRVATALAIIGSGLAVGLFLHAAQRRSVVAASDEGFDDVLAWLRSAPRDGVICLPATRAEAVAYRARKQVLWGAHSAGYERLVEFYPVLRTPLDELARRYQTSYLLLDRRYVDMPDLGLRNGWRAVFERGVFQVLERV